VQVFTVSAAQPSPQAVAMAWCGDALPAIVFGAKYVAVPGVFALLTLVLKAWLEARHGDALARSGRH